MSYEIPLPTPDELQRKPILNASELHRHIEKAGLSPMAVVVDNANARVRELTERERKRLVDAVMDFYRRWVGVEK
jgi:hypothetical protein